MTGPPPAGDGRPLKRLRHLAGRAIHKYKLIQDGDRIAVGVSGGKDSLVLIHFLTELAARAPVKFSLGVIHLEPAPMVTGLAQEELDSSLARLKAWLADLPLDFLHLEAAPEVPELAAWRPGGPSPCWNCARLRRKRLFDLCRYYQADSLALGHHLDDAVETLLMNIFHSGRLEGLGARQELFSGRLTIIRPLILTPENLARRLAVDWGLPVLPKTCPADGQTTRQEIKNLVASLAEDRPKIRGHLAAAAEAAAQSVNEKTIRNDGDK